MMSLGMKTERPRLILLFFVVLVIAFTIPIAINYQASLDRKRVAGPSPELVYRDIAARSRLVTVDELVKAFGEDLLLPTWMPDGLKLRKIYLWGNETTYAILSYADREVSDYRYGNITIQLKKPTDSGLVPNDPNIVDLGGLQVSTRDRILFFFHKSTYYLMTGEFPREVFIEIAKNMRTTKT